MKKILLSTIVVISLFLIYSQAANAWSNLIDGDHSQGVHDILARAAYNDLKEYNADYAQWITDWYGGGTVSDTNADEFLAWTDNPDYNYQDWAAHNLDHHKYGYHGEQAPATMAPRVVKIRYDSAACYLSNWIKNGKPTGSLNEKLAVKNAALLSHYLADMTQAMHTDSTSTLGEESSEAGTTGSSYHSHYEGKSLEQAWADDMTIKAENHVYTINTKINDVETSVLAMADDINTDGGKSDVLSSEGDPVGAGYWYIVDTYYNNWNNAVYYLDSRGYDEALYAKTVEIVRKGIELYGQILYSIYEDALNMSVTGCDTSAVVGDVLLSEVYYDPIVSDAEWVEICNRANHPVDVSGWSIRKPLAGGRYDEYVIEEGNIIFPGYCFIITKDGSSFASDPRSITTDSSVCFDRNQPNDFGGCAALANIDETYDPRYNPGGEQMIVLSTSGDELYLVDASGTIMDYVAWEGEGGWSIYANEGYSIARAKDANGVLIDTDSESDWLSEQIPTPAGGLIGTSTI